HQYVLQRVRLTLDPELVLELDVRGQAVRGGLARADDDAVVVWCCDRARAVGQAPGEEVVPRRESPVLVRGVVLVLLDADSLPGGFAFPAGRRVVEDVAGVATAEKLAPCAQDLLDHRVDPPVAEGSK